MMLVNGIFWISGFNHFREKRVVRVVDNLFLNILDIFLGHQILEFAQDD